MSQTRHAPESGVNHLLGGGTIGRHAHPEHQLIYVSAGVLVAQTAHGSWVASSDRGIWMPSGIWHEHRAYGASTVHTLSFDLERAPLRVGSPTIIAVGPLVRELLLALTETGLRRPEAARLRAVLRDRLRATAQEPISLRTPDDARLARACRIALDHLDTPMSLPMLAERAGTAERTLSRLFRRQIGMSYPQWRARARALEAMILLAQGESVTDTAQRCGWNTTSAFIDSFRQESGQTPGAYRELTAA